MEMGGKIFYIKLCVPPLAAHYFTSPRACCLLGTEGASEPFYRVSSSLHYHVFY